MTVLDLVGLKLLMEMSEGRPEIKVGIIDGPVATQHSDLENILIQSIGVEPNNCKSLTSMACKHGTFVAGILFGKRGGLAPGICPGCTLLVQTVFGESKAGMPSAKPEELAFAIIQAIHAGARVLNISAGIAQLSVKHDEKLVEALDYAAKHGVLVVAAAGNQGTLGSSPITRHHWVIPVIACNMKGAPTIESNLGRSLARRGLSVPAEAVTSLNAVGGSLTFGGTSAAAPFVTGTIALLLSQFPHTSGERVKSVLLHSVGHRSYSVVPPLLNAWKAYEFLKYSGGPPS
jgi:subtilisin family serine protease